MVVVFPAPLGPRNAKDFTFGYVEGHIIDSGKRAESLNEIADTDHGNLSPKKTILNGSVQFVNLVDLLCRAKESLLTKAQAERRSRHTTREAPK
jgi:hypothetical protein